MPTQKCAQPLFYQGNKITFIRTNTRNKYNYQQKCFAALHWLYHFPTVLHCLAASYLELCDSVILLWLKQ